MNKPILLFVMSVLPFVVWGQTTKEPLYREGQVIVKFKSAPNKARGAKAENSVSKALQLIGGTNAQQLMPLAGAMTAKSRGGDGNNAKDYHGLSELYVLQFNKKQSVENTIEKLKKHGDVQYAEPNYIVRAVGRPSAAPFPQPEINDVSSAPSFNDPQYSEQWDLQAINMPALWEKPVINSKRPIIAILDTGVDITHPDLATNIWTNTAEKGYDEDGNGLVGDIHGWNFVDNTSDISDPDGHGTHCAGIAAAAGNNSIGIVGANPDALIMPLKVLDENGGGDVASCIRALDYAVANGADVISMSYARSCPGKSTNEGEMEAMEEVAKYAVLVASAGNDGVCMNQRHQKLHGSGKFPDPYFPAAYPFVIGVQASDKNGSLADFSNFDCRRTPSVTVYGEKKTPLCYEIYAPGVDILSTLPSGKYGSMEGTSMSGPLVAGALSRLLQTKSNLDNTKLLTMISLVCDNKVLDMLALYNVQDVDLPKHSVDEIFKADYEGNEITFRVTSASTVQVGDASYPAIDNPSNIVTIPETIDGLKVTAIGSYAFSCAFVDKVILPNSLVFISNSAFESCHITSVSIPESVVDIGENAFWGCQITSLFIPKNVECISEGAFSSIPGLESIQVDSDNKRFNSNNNCNAIIETVSGTLISGIDNIPEGVKIVGDYAFLGKDFETITIPNTVEEIGIGAFSSCRNLKSADFPESVVSIGFSAYNMCEGLKSVHLSKNVSSIGSGAFGYCQNIESFTIDEGNPIYDSRENCNAIIDKVSNTLIQGFNCSTIPSNIEGIAYNSFYYCDKLESVVIPKTVSHIDLCPFIGCRNLRSVIVEKDNPYYDSRDNCSAIIETATDKFLWGNEYSTIPSGVKTIGIDAFWGSEFPKNATVKIPKGVERLEHGSLNIYASNVTFHIPSTIKEIDDYTAQGDFKALYCYATEPFNITPYTFRECNKSTLYVPKGCKEAYEEAYGWNTFRSIEEIDITPIISTDQTVFCNTVDKESDLTSTILYNTYFTLDKGQGDGYDDTERALVLSSTTTTEDLSEVEEAEVGDEALRDKYSGIIFELSAGSGTVTVDALTAGTYTLNVKIGKNEPTCLTSDKRTNSEIKYDVKEPTYVYLYASASSHTNSTRAAGTENKVLLYGYTVTVGKLQGDVNEDGDVDNTDLEMVANYIIYPYEDFNKAVADMNGDGEVNAIDLVLIINKMTR